MHQLTRLAAALAVALAAVLSAARPADAHVNISSSSPPDGAVLASVPELVTLEFSGTVSQQLAEITVTNSTAKPVTISGLTLDASGTQLLVALPELPDDSYRVAYSVRDPLDLHLTTGSIVFGVGCETLPAGGAPVTPIKPIGSALRWIAMAGILLALGAASVALGHGRSITDGSERVGVISRSLSLVLVGVTTAAVGELSSALYQILDVGAPLTDTARKVMLSSAFGTRVLIALQLAIALALITRMAKPVLTHRRGPPTTMLDVVPLLLLLGMVVVAAFGGHPAAGGPFAVGVGLRAAHLAAVGLWVGGLGALVIVLPKAGQIGRQELMRSFTKLAAPAAVIAITSGLVLAGREVTSLTALLTTTFGAVLSAKVLLVAAALVFGTRHALRISTASRSSMAVEAALLALVVGGGAILSTLPPAIGERFDPAPSASPFVRTEQTSDLLVRVSLRPNKPGRNTLDVSVIETRRPSLGPIAEIGVTLSPTSGNAVRESAVPSADGSISVPVDISAPGPLDALVSVARAAAPVAPLHVAWKVDGAAVPRAATRVSDQPIARYVDVLAALVAVLGMGWSLARSRRVRSSRSERADSEDLESFDLARASSDGFRRPLPGMNEPELGSA